MRGRWLRRFAIVLILVAGSAFGVERVVVDLDPGDDIDDAFALALIVASPEFDVVGVSTAWGDTALRVRLVQRLLHAAGRDEIPVAQGIATTSTTVFSQARWASRWPVGDKPVQGSVDLLLNAAADHPGEVTLLALGPLTNVAAALRHDPRRFGQFKRIVMMGGSVRRGYGRAQYAPPTPPAREYNIGSDVAAAQAVFASGVPIQMFPLDATLVQLDEVRRRELFAHGSSVTDALLSLYYQWSTADAPWASTIPTLFDVVPVATLIDATLCPMVAMRIVVGDDGFTREGAGAANARVCLGSDRQRVMDLMMRRLLMEPLAMP
jgi:inosine-uridine nucleoside N-ribohydrolase